MLIQFLVELGVIKQDMFCRMTIAEIEFFKIRAKWRWVSSNWCNFLKRWTCPYFSDMLLFVNGHSFNPLLNISSLRFSLWVIPWYVNIEVYGKTFGGVEPVVPYPIFNKSQFCKSQCLQITADCFTVVNMNVFVCLDVSLFVYKRFVGSKSCLNDWI